MTMEFNPELKDNRNSAVPASLDLAAIRIQSRVAHPGTYFTM
jgi:hypothetical protein